LSGGVEFALCAAFFGFRPLCQNVPAGWIVKFRIVLEFDPQVRSYSAVCPELPGCASAGETEDEARRNIEEAIKLYLAPADIPLPDNAKLVEVTIG
jgi:predicted RNase H-like HicB family nuclease